MEPRVFTGCVRAGKLHVRGWRPFSGIHDCEVTITVEKRHATRSLDQNRLYWRGYVQPLSEHTGYDAMAIHAYLKKRFLPNQHLMIQNSAGEVVDETDIEPTTRRLNKVEFSEYLHAIEAWAMEELSVSCGSNREAA